MSRFHLLRDRARAVGYGLIDKYDGHIHHPALKEARYAITKNWGAQPYTDLDRVEDAIAALERSPDTPPDKPNT